MNLPVPRPEVSGIDRCAHGAVSDSELGAFGLTYADVIDFSVNSNPLGPSPAVWAALAGVDPSRYPDDECRKLREALAVRAGVDPDRVIVGNGSSELLWLLALAYLRPGDALLALTPTFGEYERVARLMGAKVETVLATAERGFRHDLTVVAETIAPVRPRVVYIGNPNNPTGVYEDPGAIEALALSAPETLFVVDEAYMGFLDVSFTPDTYCATREKGTTGGVMDSPNVVHLRSLTKDYALAGLRLGYALATPEVVRALRAAQPPWSVSAAAQAAGLAAIADEAHLRAARAEIARARQVVTTGLGRLGLRVFPSACNFVLVEVANAKATRSALLRHRCVVRDCTSFGLPGHVRIGLRTVAECERLVEAFGEVIACPARP